MSSRLESLPVIRHRAGVSRPALGPIAGRLLRHRMVQVGGFILMLVLATALLAPVLASQSPALINPAQRLLAPSLAHPLGTDELGRDLFSRVVWGSRVSLEVGAAVALVCVLAGGAVGLVAGYFRRLDNFLMRLMDGMMAFPATLLAIAIMASLGARVTNVIIALSVAYLPRLARVVRAQVLVLREQTYVEAAVAQGATEWRILLRHILPNCASPLLIQASATFAYAVLTEAALSFLGVGVPTGVASWGGVLSDGRNFMIQAPWITFFPGAAISLTVLGLNLFGDGLRDVLDPRNR